MIVMFQFMPLLRRRAIQKKRQENKRKLEQLWELVGGNKKKLNREKPHSFNTLLAQHVGTSWLGKVLATLGFFL